MLRLISAALAALLLASASAWAGSTIDPTVPAENSPKLSAPLRNNFAAAYADINHILNEFSGSSAPSSPSVFQLWADTSTTPATIRQYDGASWVPLGTLDATNHLWSVVADGVAITPPASTVKQGISIVQTGAGSPGNYFDYNNITINSDNVDTGGVPTVSAGLGLIMSTGGAADNGPRAGIRSTIGLHTLQGTSADVSAINGEASADVNDGGTNTGAGAKGTIWGVNSFAVLSSGATNYLSVAGGEVDIGIYTGASANSRMGWSMIGIGNLTGTVTDAAIQFGSVIGGTPWVNALLLSDRNGAAPLQTTGCVFCTDGSSHTIATGIDLSSYTITGNFLKSANFTVGGNGQVSTTTGSGIAFSATSSGATQDVIQLDNTAGGNRVGLNLFNAGSAKWQILKETDNSFLILDNTSTLPAFTISTAGNTNIGETGKTLTLVGATLTLPVNSVSLASLAQSAANTMLGNWTGSTASVTANAMPSCADSGGNHLNYVSGTGITCGTSTGAAAAGSLTGTTLAANVVTSSLTTVGTLASPTLTTPVINGLPTGTGVATANTVSTLVARDGSGNFSAGTITATLNGASPAGNLSGATLAAGVTASSLTSLGTLTGLTVTNSGALTVSLQSGSTNAAILAINANGGSQQAVTRYSDAGTLKWIVGKQTDNTFIVFDNANASNALGVSTSGNVTIGETAGTVAINHIVTGTNVDFVCLGSGGVLLIQASACTISSGRFKNIDGGLADGEALADVLALRPVAFRMKAAMGPNADPNYAAPQLGLTAENVASVEPRAAVYEDDMRTPKSYRQESIIAMTVGSIRALQAQIDRLQAEVRQLRSVQ
jgi:hypothetical protein